METVVIPELPERRQHRRYRGEDRGVRFARIRPGHDVSVIDVSASGMLVESTHRLLPGSAVDVRFSNDRHSAQMIRGRVVRCGVIHLQANAIGYRAAIAFDRHMPCIGRDFGYQLPTCELRPMGDSRVFATRKTF